MADVHNKETRSYNMSRIRSKNTKPELVLRKALFAAGYRYRLHNDKLPGKPDIVLKKYRLVIFVNGCFWHGHENCKYFKLPTTRQIWWAEKINKNKENDKSSLSLLDRSKWNVYVVWECQLKKEKLQNTLIQLFDVIENTTTISNSVLKANLL